MRQKPSELNGKPDVSFGEIDIYSLHTEWVRQDRLVGYYGTKLAKAKRKHEECKTACQVFEAETARRIRRKPLRYGVKRLTESAVKEAVHLETLTSDEHSKLIEAKYEVDLYDAAMKRLEHRKRLLSDMVYLQGQSYYAEPVMPKHAKMRDKVQRAREDQLHGLRED
jgi:hypothetical protein